MERSSPGIPRILVALAALMLVVVACGGPAAESPGAESPAGESPATESPAAESPGEESPAAESPGEESPGEESPGAAPTFGEIGGTVSVIGVWAAEEEEAFRAMVAPFEEMTGVTVEYTGTRDLEAVLTTGIASGTVQDLAGLPGPGQMQQWAADGHLVDLSTVLDAATYEAETAPAFVELGTVDGELVGVFIKSAVKGLFWYNTAHFTGEPPATWDDLVALPNDPAESKFCVAFESQADSGWPGTDWIEDFVLRQSGPDVYDRWITNEVKWTDPEIRQAFETFRDDVLANSFGGSQFINNTPFGQGGNPLFDDPPGCLFHHQASFITSFFQDEAGATPDQYDFFPFPDINPEHAGAVEGAGDLFGMFRDTEQSRALMQWLVSAEAQQIWVDRGGALSGNLNVTQYPDEVSQRSAELLANAETFRFDAGDLMGGEVNSAFFSAMVQFADNPDNLDSILENLDQIHADSLNQ